MSVYSALAYKNKRLSDFHHRLYVYLWAYQERMEDDVSHAAMAEALSVLAELELIGATSHGRMASGGSVVDEGAEDV